MLIMADSREEFEKAREILDFTFNGDELLTGRDWDWELWQAAQAAMQPEKERYRKENDILRGLIAVSDVACVHCGLKDISQCRSGFPGCSRADDIIAAEDAVYTSTRQQLTAANQRIAELEKDYAVWREYTGKVNDRNIELKERIRVADAEEPVGYVQKGIYVNSAGRLAISNEQLPVYLHAQIPAEVELKAKIAELQSQVEQLQADDIRIKEWFGKYLCRHNIPTEYCDECSN